MELRHLKAGLKRVRGHKELAARPDYLSLILSEWQERVIPVARFLASACAHSTVTSSHIHTHTLNVSK